MSRDSNRQSSEEPGIQKGTNCLFRAKEEKEKVKGKKALASGKVQGRMVWLHRITHYKP